MGYTHDTHVPMSGNKKNRFVLFPRSRLEEEVSWAHLFFWDALFFLRCGTDDRTYVWTARSRICCARVQECGVQFQRVLFSLGGYFEEKFNDTCWNYFLFYEILNILVTYLRRQPLTTIFLNGFARIITTSERWISIHTELTEVSNSIYIYESGFRDISP